MFTKDVKSKPMFKCSDKILIFCLKVNIKLISVTSGITVRNEIWATNYKKKKKKGVMVYLLIR